MATGAPGTKQTARTPKAKPAAAKSGGRIVETAQEARSAEPGPSVLALLTVSTVAAVFVLGIVWFIFFRT
ncbi:MAG: hypothetical protein AB1342_10795 [Pseudomonadota bacterium]|jgi:hypothetical protein